MPRAWSNKDERAYEHIKKSAKDRGEKTKRAKEIAARTVNKQRMEEGRSQSRKSRATGNPRSGLEVRTREELYHIAQDRNIEGRSKMNKDELVRAIRNKR
jgi:hypothetical protein